MPGLIKGDGAMPVSGVQRHQLAGRESIKTTGSIALKIFAIVEQLGNSQVD